MCRTFVGRKDEGHLALITTEKGCFLKDAMENGYLSCQCNYSLSVDAYIKVNIDFDNGLLP